jgi:hypothetical protein
MGDVKILLSMRYPARLAFSKSAESLKIGLGVLVFGVEMGLKKPEAA